MESSVVPPRALTTHPTGVTLGCLFPREGPAASATPLRLVVKATVSLMPRLLRCLQLPHLRAPDAGLALPPPAHQVFHFALQQPDGPPRS